MNLTDHFQPLQSRLKGGDLDKFLEVHQPDIQIGISTDPYLFHGSGFGHVTDPRPILFFLFSAVCKKIAISS